MRLRWWSSSLVCLSLGLVACGDSAGSPDAAIDAVAVDAAPDAPTGPDANTAMPPTLADTGLCVDAACTQIAADVHLYTPRWALWSDGAAKKRYVYLPPGTTIDTSDMDHWKFPVGAKLWKEFTRDNVRVETRFFQKNGPNDTDWYFVAYAWNEAQDMAVALPAGGQNVLGTQHDIPQRADCRKCHDQVPGRILGFSALQLDYDAPSGELDLDDLIQMNALSAPPTITSSPHFPLPTATTTEIAALGYLHANCGHCHNPASSVHQIVPQELRLSTAPSALATLGDTPTYKTTVGVTPTMMNVPGATAIVVAGDATKSAMYLRFTSDNAAIHMPPIATEIHDTAAAQVMADWINHIP